MLKKTRRVLTAALLSTALLSPIQAVAETLTDALRWAYQDNPELNAARANVRQQLESVKITNAATRPKVNFSANYGINSGDLYVGNWRDNDQLSATLSASLLLYDGGRTALAVDAGLANTRATNLRLIASEQNILLGTVQAYLNVLRDRALVSSSRTNIDALNTRLNSARVAYDTGAATITELAQTEAALAQARADLSSSQANLAVSEAQYEALTGRKPGSLTAIGSLPSLPGSLSEAEAIGNASSPLVLAALESERAAMIEMRRTRDASMPQVDLSASATRSNNLDGAGYIDNNQVGIQVTIPIYNGGQIPALQRQAQALLEARAAETTGTRMQVKQNVAAAWAQLQNAGVFVSAMQQVVEAQSLADQGAEVEYEVGALTVSDRLDAQQNLIAARSNLLTAQYQRQFAAYQLLAAMGKLGVEELGLRVPKIDAVVVETAPSTPKSEAAKAVDQLLDRWGN